MYESKYHYEPHPEEDVVYEDELDYSDGERVVFDTGSRFGGLDLATALGLTGVGYVANSGQPETASFMPNSSNNIYL